MESLRELYRIGRGPSSSHTLAPDRAARLFAAEYEAADSFRAVLYGSLAKTGRGHLTDRALSEAFLPRPCDILFDTQSIDLPHPNTFDLYAYQEGREIGQWRIISAGGGKIIIHGQESLAAPDVYPHSSFAAISADRNQQRLRLPQYVEQLEGEDIQYFLLQIWSAMREAIYAGLDAEGDLPGSLDMQRKARYLHGQKHIDESAETRANRLVCSYAFAVSEQNAGGGRIVTAPTCGSSGVLPAVLLYMQEKNGFSDLEITRALAAAGVIGNLIKTNASISGAECGCQAEIGSACAMAAAALAELFDMDLEHIEYAAEVAMEHHLGLTCDPIDGLVQIPCIERNAVAAMRAINAFSLANFLTHTRKISLDMVIATMYETGRDLFSQYRETGEGGLAKKFYEEAATDEAADK